MNNTKKIMPFGRFDRLVDDHPCWIIWMRAEGDLKAFIIFFGTINRTVLDPSNDVFGFRLVGCTTDIGRLHSVDIVVSTEYLLEHSNFVYQPASEKEFFAWRLRGQPPSQL